MLMLCRLHGLKEGVIIHSQQKVVWRKVWSHSSVEPRLALAPWGLSAYQYVQPPVDEGHLAPKRPKLDSAARASYWSPCRQKFVEAL
jgi:hypothetical protein